MLCKKCMKSPNFTLITTQTLIKKNPKKKKYIAITECVVVRGWIIRDIKVLQSVSKSSDFLRIKKSFKKNFNLRVTHCNNTVW